MRGMIHDALGGCTQFIDIDINETIEMEPDLLENNTPMFLKQTHPEIDKFERLMKEANEEQYLGCKKFRKLSFVLHIYHTKCMYKWSNESFDSLLERLKDALPERGNLTSFFL
ncbi:hypothetical protein RDI58_029006 [Solanum bulbocastanum]|uniref:Uncharacterized protein n=1 Tax=Solanum bulbocastanum TaxID=147425 RepID=A0AAN8SWP0_SOLBU